MKNNSMTFEKAQSLIIFVILVFVFLGMLALVLDGGYGYFQRRLAQNAADAGALAGAEVFCETGIWQDINGDGAKKVAEDQATDFNYAMVATASHLDQDGNGILNEEDRLVRVDANITFNTFFGSILGQDSIAVVADATAGCYPPINVTGVLPLGWSCREPIIVEGEENEWDTKFCELLYNNEQYDPLDGQMYLIADSDKIPEGWEYLHACQDPTLLPEERDPELLDCDIDNDGIDDIITGGDKTWLNLSRVTAGTSELKKWISQEEKITLERHIWAQGIDGDRDTVYAEIKLYEGEQFVLPVYNHFCDTTSKAEPFPVNKLSNTKCYNDYSNDVDKQFDEIYFDDPGQHYHIINYVMFRVTCVSHAGHWNDCDVKNEAVLNDLIGEKTRTIEGYFTWGNIVGADGGPNTAPWLGVWKVYLID